MAMEIGTVVESSCSKFDDIPAELMAKIFACLPVHMILKLRSVCKLWYTIVSSSSFSSVWSKRNLQTPSWIIMYTGRDSFAAFDPTSSTWFTLPIPCPPGNSYRKRILTSSGGLICFCLFNESSRVLIVCNPITRECRTLPELPIHVDDFHAEMLMDQSSTSYTIYVAESIMGKDSLLEEGAPQAAFYSSLDNSWYTLSTTNLPFCEGCQGDNAVLHAKTFFTVSKVGPPHQLTMYNPVDHQATMVRLPFERSMSLFPPLCVRQGRLFLAGGVWEYLPFSSFNIWELDHCSNKFVQIDSMACSSLDDSHIPPLPKRMLQRFGSSDILFFHARVLLCPLVYDVKEKFWLCMPRYYGPCKSWVPSILYEPSFSAKV